MKITFRKAILFFIAFMSIASTTNASSIDLSYESANISQTDKLKKLYGRIMDSNDLPIPGANIIIKGTNIGVSTDPYGKFYMKIPAAGDVILVVSFIGYETREIKVSSKQDEIFVNLKEDTKVLSDIVVTGFERVDKRKLTGSVQTLDAKEIITPAAISVDNMLASKVAGVQIIGGSSSPGVTPKIRIRGTSSITGNREPIWVVDGVVLTDPVKISNSDLNSLDNVNRIGNAISFLNPHDIERIDILKDVSATAIYGVKAANGVIVVTTKRGRKGRMSVNYSTSVTMTERPSYRQLDLMNSDERIQLSQEIHARGLKYGSGDDPKVGYEGLLDDLWNKRITYSQFNEQVEEIRKVNTDWFDILMRNPLSQNHNLSISGGGEKTTYYISGSATHDKGVELSSSLKRYTLNLKVNTKLTDKLSLTLGTNASFGKSKRPHQSVDLMGYAMNTSRALKFRNADGSLFFYPVKNSMVEGHIKKNMLHELRHTSEGQSNNTLSLNLQMSYKLFKDANLNLQLSRVSSNVTTYSKADAESFYISSKRQTIYGQPIPDDKKGSAKHPFGGELNRQSTDNVNTSGRLSLEINKSFDKNVFTFQAGTSLSSSHYKGLRIEKHGYFPDRGNSFVKDIPDKYSDFRKVMANQVPSITDQSTNMVSFYGIFRYTYDNKYTLNFNIRGDGSNKFGQDESTRFLPVGSVSGRWNISREKFFENTFRFVDAMAFKASYGFQGNVSEDQTPNLILENKDLDAMSEQFPSVIHKHANKNLIWEKTKSYQLGVDLTLFKGFLSGSFEYYYKKGVDQIINRKVSPTNGFSSTTINAGEIVNEGWDLSATLNFINKKDWAWNLSVNTGKNENRVTKGGINEAPIYLDYLKGSLIKNGTSVNSFYSYKLKGLDKNGLPLFDGINMLDDEGNAISKSKTEAILRAMEYSGKREPVISGGANTNIRYKNLSFSATFSYALGHKVRLYDLYKSEQKIPLPDQNLSAEFNNRWRKPGDENRTNIPVVTDNALVVDNQPYEIGKNKYEMYNNSNIRVVDADYIRLQNVSLNYTLPQKFVKNLHLQSASVGFNAANVYTFASSKLNGQNPDHFGGMRTVPQQRSYSLSLSVTF